MCVSLKTDWVNLSHFPKYSEDNGQHALAFDDRENILSSDNQSPVDNMFPVHKRESKEKTLPNKCVHEEVKKTEESLSVVPHEGFTSIHAVSKVPSTPDVIIEEIYEGNLESKLLNT